MNISAQLIKAATGSTEANAAKFEAAINQACERFGIDTPARVAGFLSQVGHESGGLGTLQESLNYRVEALMGLFGRHRITEPEAMMYGRIEGKQPANQEALANLLYGGDFGRKNLGNTEPGDGWKFRGRGLKQLTGRSNYDRCGQALGLDLVASPDLLVQPEAAALSAAWFWKANNLNELADKADVAAMTKRINGGAIGLDQRKALYAAAMSAAGGGPVMA